MSHLWTISHYSPPFLIPSGKHLPQFLSPSLAFPTLPFLLFMTISILSPITLESPFWAKWHFPLLFPVEEFITIDAEHSQVAYSISISPPTLGAKLYVSWSLLYFAFLHSSCCISQVYLSNFPLLNFSWLHLIYVFIVLFVKFQKPNKSFVKQNVWFVVSFNLHRLLSSSNGYLGILNSKMLNHEASDDWTQGS